MIFRSFHVDAFGPFRDQGVHDLPAGLILAQGPNESGKSSLLEFFRWLLFGSRGSGDSFPEEEKGGRLQWESSDGESWAVERNAQGKESLSGSASLTRWTSLAEFLGGLDRRTFERVYALGLEDLQGQEVLRSEDAGGSSMAYGLGRLNLESLLRQLQAQGRAELTTRGSRARIPAALLRLEQLVTELREATASSQQSAQVTREIKLQEESARAHRREKNALEDRKRHVDLLLQALEPWHRWQAAQKELSALEQSPIHLVPPMAGSAQKISSLVTRLDQLRQVRTDLRRQEDLRRLAFRPKPPKQRPAASLGPQWFAMVPLAVLVCIAIPFALGSLSSTIFLAAALPLTFLALALGWLQWWSSRGPREAPSTKPPLEGPTAEPTGSLEQIRTELAQVDEELRATEGTLADLTKSLSLGQEELRQGDRNQEAGQHEDRRLSERVRAEVARYRGSLEGLLANDEHLEAEIVTATKESLEEEASHLARTLTDLERKTTLNAERRGRLEARLEDLERREDASSLLLEKTVLEEEIRRNLRRWIKSVLGRKLLEQARAVFHRQRLPRILRHAGTFLAGLTGEDLEIQTDPEGNLEIVDGRLRRRKAGAWSEGLGDQVYLSLRLALAEELDPPSGPLPLLLDDILVRFDPIRRKRALRVLLELSARRQIFLFSSHPELRDCVMALARETPPIRPWGVLELRAGTLRLLPNPETPSKTGARFSEPTDGPVSRRARPGFE